MHYCKCHMLHCSPPSCQCAVQLCSCLLRQLTNASSHGGMGYLNPLRLSASLQSAKEDLQSFGLVVVEMVRDACRDTISCLEVNMNETLGRTSKLVSALSRSAGPRRGESECPVATLQVLNTAFRVRRALPDTAFRVRRALPDILLWKDKTCPVRT